MIKGDERVKIKILFLLCVLLCISTCNAYALEGIDYCKSENEVVVTVNDIPLEKFVFIIGQYSNDEKSLIKSDVIEVDEHNGTYESETISLTDGFKYKFFVWDNMDNIMPLYTALSLTTVTPDGNGNSNDIPFDGDSYEDDIFDD